MGIFIFATGMFQQSSDPDGFGDREKKHSITQDQDKEDRLTKYSAPRTYQVEVNNSVPQ